MKKNIIALLLAVSFVFGFALAAFAAPYDQVLARWTKSRKFVDEDGANLEVKATYYSAEMVEAMILQEAQKNLYTQQETDSYKAKLLSTLNLNQVIPINVQFDNNGPTMYLGPFDIMVKLRIGGKTYKAVEYDKRLNFKFQGKKEGLVFFPRFDEKTGKDLLKGQKLARLEISSSISPIIQGSDISFVWEISNDDPQRLYQGAAANKLETDRLLKRLDKLRKDKAAEQAKIDALNSEITTIQQRVDELAKQ